MILPDNPSNIIDMLTYRNRKTLQKISDFCFRPMSRVARSPGFVRVWPKLSGRGWNSERLSYAAISRLWEMKLIALDTKNNRLVLTPLGELVCRYIETRSRKQKAKTPIFEYDETGQYNLNI